MNVSGLVVSNPEPFETWRMAEQAIRSIELFDYDFSLLPLGLDGLPNLERELNHENMLASGDPALNKSGHEQNQPDSIGVTV